MPRVRDQERAALVAARVADFVGLPRARRPKRRKSPKTGPGPLALAVDEARALLLSGELGPMQPAQLVGLYALCHEDVYGVSPADLADGKNFLGAKSAARKMVANEFAGDAAQAARFVCWCWSRERDREQWRRENKREGGRIDWRSQFVRRALLTDYRLAGHRA